MPQIVVIVLSTILLGFVFKPVLLISGYFIFRPLVHPFALEQLKLLSLPITWPFAVVMVFGVVAAMLRQNSFRIFHKNIIPLYLLFILSLLSIVFSINTVSSVSQSIKFFNAILIVLLVVNTANSIENIINIYKGIVLSSIVPMIYGYYQFIFGQGHVVLGEHTSRITSFFGYANLYGIFLALIIFSCLIVYVETKNKRWKRIYLLILISAIVSTILALNRGSWIAITSGLLLSFIFYKKHLNIKYFIISFGLIALAAVGVIIKRFLELNERRMGADTFDDRIELWLRILDSFSTIPSFGYGAGTAQLALTKLFNITMVPHNDYLRLLLELGIFGPIIYILLLFRELLLNVRNRKNSDAWHVNYFTLSMLIYWVIISFVQNIIHDVVVFPLFLASCYLARQYSKLSNDK